MQWTANPRFSAALPTLQIISFISRASTPQTTPKQVSATWLQLCISYCLVIIFPLRWASGILQSPNPNSFCFLTHPPFWFGRIPFPEVPLCIHLPTPYTVPTPPSLSSPYCFLKPPTGSDQCSSIATPKGTHKSSKSSLPSTEDLHSEALLNLPLQLSLFSYALRLLFSYCALNNTPSLY